MHYIVIGVLLLVLGFFAIWIGVVLFFRLLGIAVMLATIVAGVGFLVGIILGMIAPVRVLRGRAVNAPRIATPAAVREGDVLRGAPKGASANFGWDPAWPLYVPYQLKFDQLAVSAEAKGLCMSVHRTVRSKVPRPKGRIANWMVKGLAFLIAGIPTWGLIFGVIVGTALWLALTWTFSTLARFAQTMALRSMAAREVRYMKKAGATVRCTRCYNTFNMPSYQCANPSCGRMHRDVSPGPLGIRTRICECEIELPLTVAGASKSLVGFCPFCTDPHQLPQGSGSRRVIVAPVFGSVGAGKTRFLASSAVSLYFMKHSDEHDVNITALSEAAGNFLIASYDEAKAGRAPVKTMRLEKPEGYPYLIDHPLGEFELHLMDAAGENFVNMETSTSLRYLDVADSLIFLLDPLAISEVGDQLRLSPHGAEFQTAQGFANDAYGSVVERLRSSGADIRKRRLAVVVTKADAVAAVMPNDPLPDVGAEVREWLFRHGEDRLITRIEMDFEQVDYFAVASLGGSLPGTPQHPINVIDWAVVSQGGNSLAKAIPASTAQQPSEVSL